MSDASTLWDAVVDSYDGDGLISLSNIRDRSQKRIDTVSGESAAQAVITLFPSHAQVVYDSSDALHVEIAKRGTIAMLWERGGSAASIAQIEWDKVFADDGLVGKLKRTGPRGRQGPSTNSGVTQSVETVGGRNVQGWSDPGSLPGGRNYLPSRTLAE